jgi:hypothetical protein
LEIGWLSGLGEEQVDRALIAVHANPFLPRTVDALASHADMARFRP